MSVESSLLGGVAAPVLTGDVLRVDGPVGLPGRITVDDVAIKDLGGHAGQLGDLPAFELFTSTLSASPTKCKARTSRWAATGEGNRHVGASCTCRWPWPRAAASKWTPRTIYGCR
jgi:hypothetical protein